MATRWSSEYKIIEIRDMPANTMAVDYTGSVALLAGRKQYGVKEINKPTSMLHKFPRSCKYDINATEWNPNYHNKHICALAYNTQVQLLIWKDDNDLVSSTKLNTHTRTILDLNWHPFEPNIIASASMDSFVHIWDVRANARPSISLSTVIGASKVRWNHLSKHLLATVHNGDVKIWDQRKSSNPIQYISAHLNTIHCLDWSYTNENQLVTCSQDCTVKFFEINNLKKTENVLSTVTPVWRAKYTPFGDGILIVLVPPIKRVDNNLLLWNLSAINTPVHTFVGHSDTILEFQWLKNKGDKSAEHELITWSKDQTMRLWHVTPFLHDVPVENNDRSSTNDLDIYRNMHFSETSNIANDTFNGFDVVDHEVRESTFSMSSHNESFDSDDFDQKNVSNLQQEFLSMNICSEVFIEQKDPDRRVLIATVKLNNNSVSVFISFPLGYPINVEPHFQITKCTYDSNIKNKILKVLYDSAHKQVSKNMTCIQYCFRELVNTLKKSRISFSENQFVDDDKKTYSIYSQSPSHFDRTSTYASYQESYNILQSKTMGLKFCNNGALLWFNSPSTKSDYFPSISLQKIDTGNNSIQYHSPQQTVQSYWFNGKTSSVDNNNRSLKSNRKDRKFDRPIVAVYDVSCLFPISKDLASKYELNTMDVFNTCLKNASITNSFKRKDLVQTWTLAAYACNTNLNLKKKSTSQSDQVSHWKNHPFTMNLIDSLISHYAGHSDYQTAALLCCVFDPNAVFKNVEHERSPTPVYTRSNSLSDGFSFSRGQEESAECYEVGDHGLVFNDNCSNKEIYYDEYKKTYMDVLDNLGLLDQQASVKKFLKHQTQKSNTVLFKFFVECIKCKSSVIDGYCSRCQRFNLKCSICNSTVRGAAHVCLVCGHGGHANHLVEWFNTETTCAANCGCCCIYETMSVLHIKRHDLKED
ncbi:GATOR complex protein WDR59 [Adelges cooleyi]|uniref:GATOR complex protein WDR59 n=1 Tax=Adelges cooleyi TaxID=133065 RepID=UPI0021804C8D|nr:GATOR complex protein WDR59 [Adelges cooleyi]XP_050443842.1 GATOR complex protein WDR59 [Adelges cooleyi]XP_050443843.1 GATOR complex protein WDR59 [Adelges cooleyi]